MPTAPSQDLAASPPAWLTVQAGPRPLPDLLAIAAAAARSGTGVRFEETGARPIEDLVRLAVAGGDSVWFGNRTAPDGAGAPPGAPRRPWRRMLAHLAVF